MTAPAATEGVRKDPLLAELLLPEQAHDLEAHGGFNVRGSDGNLYRILDKKLGLRNVLGESPRHIGRVLFGAWPCYRGGVIIADRIAVMLSQKIFIEGAAPRFIHLACGGVPAPNEIRDMDIMGDYDGKI